MTAILGSLAVVGTDYDITYGTGAGEFIYLMPGTSLDPGLALEYYEMNCSVMPPDPLFGDAPARLRCSDGVMRCTQASCAGSPPPPWPPPLAKMAVRTGLSFQPQLIQLGPLTGPVFSLAYPAMPDFDTIVGAVGAWLDLPQDPPIMMHVYWLVDPNASTQTPHPLHQHIIGIPVSLPLVPPIGPL